MQQDSIGHALTTDSADAAAAFDRAVASYIAWRIDTIDIQAATMPTRSSRSLTPRGAS